MAILPTKSPELYGLTDVQKLIGNIIDFALLIAGGIAMIYIIIGAYGYFTAFGNEEKVNKAKTTILWAIVGVIVIILAKVLISEVWSVVTTTPPSFPTPAGP